ncbi:MAG: type I glutamate--ammonia ligase [Chloroflexi bacterium HGW-Chloroflexi-10]|nr:MAG: type I glutamate--ammonia ligase [Chloroflexi bacterium HGW-Chloroflexi-10]
MTNTKLLPIEEISNIVYSKNGKDNGNSLTPNIERCSTPKDVLEYAKKRHIAIVDYKFTDLLGRWHHFSTPIHHLNEELFVEGLGFDGSSIRAFQEIHESDMILFPDPTTAIIDPAMSYPTLSIVCNIHDPITKAPYDKDPRYVAAKAEKFLLETGIADTSCWGPEAEFFVFDGIRFGYETGRAFYEIESDMAEWESGRGHESRYGANLGYRPELKRGYFRVPPVDSLQDWRSEAILRMMMAGIDVEVHHGEVASGGQEEIDLKYGPLVSMGDTIQLYKYILKNTAVAHGKTLTFMPKPMFGDNGSGMHCHQSLWKNGKNLFYDANGYAGLSQMAQYYIGGILKHTPALLAICAPTTNSYKRLVPGYEAPVMMAYSSRNRSACVRIPMYSNSPNAIRVEYRCPDPSANPYLAFSAMLLAGIDGILNKIDPGSPMDIDLFEEEAPDVKQVPGSLDDVLNELEKDHEFLLQGGVFTEGLIKSFIGWKRKNEVDALRLRTHPIEYVMYYDV